MSEPVINKKMIIVWSAVTLVMASPLIPWPADPTLDNAVTAGPSNGVTAPPVIEPVQDVPFDEQYPDEAWQQDVPLGGSVADDVADALIERGFTAEEVAPDVWDVTEPPAVDTAGDNDFIGEAQDGEEVIFEDDPRWDCRWDGNRVCGVIVQGMRYLIQFQDGDPVSVRVAPGEQVNP